MEEGQNANLNNTERFATVLEDFKETRLSLVKKLDAHQTMTVQAMKNAISYRVLAPEKSVSLYVCLELVLREQVVKL